MSNGTNMRMTLNAKARGGCASGALLGMERSMLSACVLITTMLNAQPLVDIFSVNALAGGSLDRAEVSATLPIELDSSEKLFVVEPYYVQWNTATAGERYKPAAAGTVMERLEGLGGGLTYVAPIGHNWKLALAGIARYHWLGVEEKIGASQFGSAVLLGRKVGSTCTLRVGMYVNNDAFGLFVMPLLGIDWRINECDNLYGTLPGSLTYEHKVSPRFRCGASFRAYTTSFGTRDGRYIRVDDNPLGVYIDLYATPRLVLRMEGGWSIGRQVRGGALDPLYNVDTVDSHGYADHGLADSAYLRVILAFRIRLDGPQKMDH